MGYTKLMRDGLWGAITPEQAKALDEVVKTADDHLAMINSILYTAALEVGVVHIDRREISLGDFLSDLKPECRGVYGVF